MKKNPGNTGHRGYKMSTITAIGTQENKIIISLACGHTNEIDPYPGETAEAWAAHLQQGDRPFVVGKSRARCENH